MKTAFEINNLAREPVPGAAIAISWWLILIIFFVIIENKMCAAVWKQHEITLPSFKRGCHIITDLISREIAPSIKPLSSGLCHIFIKHTSCSLTINENADPDVRKDMETFFNLTVPEGHSAPWVHRDEGPDDMPAHVKASMMGSSVTIPITRGRLNLGTWQGVWLCEHRDSGGRRNVVVTIQGS